MTNRHFVEAMPVRLYESESSADTVAMRFGLDPAQVLDFSLNINPFGPPGTAIAAARTALEHCNRYPDLRLPRLRAALAHRHAVAEDALFFGAGLDDVIKLLLHALTPEGAGVLIHLPTFPRYELEARLRGARMVLVHGDSPWTVDLDAIASALAGARIELAFLCSPNNPTGEVIAPTRVAALAAAHPETTFIVDEALIDPEHDGVLAHVRAAPNVIVLRTFSKYFGLAGLRVGYAIGPPRLLQIAERGRPPFNVTHAAESAALAVLDDRPFAAHCRSTFRTETANFRSGLELLHDYRVRGGHANMLLIELLRGQTTVLVETLAAHGLLVADAACFGGLGTHAAIRVSLRGRAANMRLLAALERAH